MKRMFQPGTKLENGATIVDVSAAVDSIHVVVAHYNLRCRADLPWVCWYMDSAGHCSGGNYYKNLRDAIENFEKRLRECSRKEPAHDHP